MHHEKAANGTDAATHGRRPSPAESTPASGTQKTGLTRRSPITRFARITPAAVTATVVLWGLLLSGTNGCGDDYVIPNGSRETQRGIRFVRLHGTPYEMGYQHGTLLYDELQEGAAFIESSILWVMMEWAADWGFVEQAWQYSYPDVIEECQGLSDAVDGGISMEQCLVLAYGDVVIEYLEGGHPLGCSQFAAAGAATRDGRLIHGRNLDWDAFSFIEENPVVFYREPEGKIPHLSLGFPGNVAPFSGMNSAGISVASNETDAQADVDREGRGHVQMVRQILQEAETLEDAEAFLRAQDHTTAEILVVSDGPTGRAAVFEMTASHLGVRMINADEIVYATNHFVHPDMADKGPQAEPGDSTWNRYERLGQLLEPDGTDTLYGDLDIAGAISILRDTYNVHTGETHPPDLLDDGGSIANNGSLQSVVFVPNAGLMYVGVGPVPAVTNVFVGFSIEQAQGGLASPPPTPETYP